MKQFIFNDKTVNRLETYLLTSISDTFTVTRICRCLYRGNITLYTILSAKYLYDRFKQKAGEPENPYLVFIGSTVVACKMYMDLAYTNSSWTEICHYPVQHINQVEREILKKLDYQILISCDILMKMYKEYGDTSEIDLIHSGGKKIGFFRRMYSNVVGSLFCISREK